LQMKKEVVVVLIMKGCVVVLVAVQYAVMEP
jgi:hypothetical protein